MPKSAFDPPVETENVYELMTMRADGQFNTTVYNEDDRFRGIQGGRYVVFINPDDMAELDLWQGDLVTLSRKRTTASNARSANFRWSPTISREEALRDTIPNAMS